MTVTLTFPSHTLAPRHAVEPKPRHRANGGRHLPRENAALLLLVTLAAFVYAVLAVFPALASPPRKHLAFRPAKADNRRHATTTTRSHHGHRHSR